MDLPLISEKKKTFKKSLAPCLAFFFFRKLLVRDSIARQNFLKNANMYLSGRSDLIPSSLIGNGNFFKSFMNKYNHFFLINFMISIRISIRNKNIFLK